MKILEQINFLYDGICLFNNFFLHEKKSVYQLLKSILYLNCVLFIYINDCKIMCQKLFYLFYTQPKEDDVYQYTLKVFPNSKSQLKFVSFKYYSMTLITKMSTCFYNIDTFIKFSFSHFFQFFLGFSKAVSLFVTLFTSYVRFLKNTIQFKLEITILPCNAQFAFLDSVKAFFSY